MGREVDTLGAHRKNIRMGGEGVPGGDDAKLSLGGQTGVAGLGHRLARRALQAEGAACVEVRRGLVCSGKHM